MFVAMEAVRDFSRNASSVLVSTPSHTTNMKGVREKNSIMAALI
jgi:hypothetical protein